MTMNSILTEHPSMHFTGISAKNIYTEKDTERVIPTDISRPQR